MKHRRVVNHTRLSAEPDESHLQHLTQLSCFRLPSLYQLPRSNKIYVWPVDFSTKAAARAAITHSFGHEPSNITPEFPYVNKNKGVAD